MTTRRVFLMLLVLLVLVVGLPITFFYLVDRNLRAGIGPNHTFRLAERPTFLTEELALAKAREALDLDGLGAADWTLNEERRTAAPNGRTDEFMVRNEHNPDRGVFRFQRGPRDSRFVSVELHGDEVVCQTYQGK